MFSRFLSVNPSREFPLVLGFIVLKLLWLVFMPLWLYPPLAGLAFAVIAALLLKRYVGFYIATKFDNSEDEHGLLIRALGISAVLIWLVQVEAVAIALYVTRDWRIPLSVDFSAALDVYILFIMVRIVAYRNMLNRAVQKIQLQDMSDLNRRQDPERTKKNKGEI